MRRVAPAVVLAGALLLSAQAPQPRLHGLHFPVQPTSEDTVDAWTIGIVIDATGNPTVSFLQRRPAYLAEIAPCASPADLRDVHSADLPQPPRFLFAGDLVWRDAVVTAMNGQGRAICARIWAVDIFYGTEHAHPGQQLPFNFVAIIPVEGVLAINISGWRGMQPKTYSIAELRRRFGR